MICKPHRSQVAELERIQHADKKRRDELNREATSGKNPDLAELNYAIRWRSLVLMQVNFHPFKECRLCRDSRYDDRHSFAKQFAECLASSIGRVPVS